MRSRRVVLAVFVLASCLAVACSSSGPEITAPAPPDSGGSTQQPPDTVPPRPPQPPVPPGPQPPLPEHPERCDDRKAQWALGEIGNQDLLERARQAAGAEFARFLRLGQSVTLEYRVGRLNLALDDRDIVRNVQCW